MVLQTKETLAEMRLCQEAEVETARGGRRRDLSQVERTDLSHRQQ